MPSLLSIVSEYPILKHINMSDIRGRFTRSAKAGSKAHVPTITTRSSVRPNTGESTPATVEESVDVVTSVDDLMMQTILQVFSESI